MNLLFMAKFCDTTEISARLAQIIKHADEKLILISPYLKIGTNFRELLNDVRKSTIIQIIYGKKELNPEEMKWLESTPIQVSFCENLHAKCYMNEQEALVTSMNLYEFSQINNTEMGIMISKKDDSELYEEINQEVKRILRKSTDGPSSINLPKKEYKPYKKKFSKGQKGFCIKCKKEIKLNPEVPYCKDCYNEWKKHKDKKYPEKYCHICGESNKSSLLKPTCYPCYKKYKNTLTFPLEV